MTQLDPTTTPAFDLSEYSDEEREALLRQLSEDAGTAAIPRGTVNALTRRAEEGDKEKVARIAAEKELALVKAGIDTSTPLGKLFADGYKGDLTVEAVKASWAALGTQGEEPGEPGTASTEEELAQQREREALGQGGTPPTGTQTLATAREQAMTRAKEGLERGLPHDDAMGVFVGSISTAALEGDSSVLVQEVPRS